MEVSSGEQPTSEQVVAALRDAGWLLEQETAATLREKDFYVATGKAFPDPDDDTVSREIDVYGYRQIFRSDELSMSVGSRLLVECKQSTLPYVVVGGPSTEHELTRDRIEQHFRFPYVETSRTDLGDGRHRLNSLHARTYLGLDQLPGNPWEPRFTGTQMTRLDRKKTWLADNRGIFTSLVYPLAKAVTHFQKGANKSSYVAHRPGQGWASIDFYYPVVVTSAPIYTVDTTADSYEAQLSPWATVTREIKSKAVDGQFNIDVVSSHHFASYLEDRVLRFSRAVRALAEAAPERFVTHEDHDYRAN